MKALYRSLLRNLFNQSSISINLFDYLGPRNKREEEKPKLDDEPKGYDQKETDEREVNKNNPEPIGDDGGHEEKN